MSHNAHYMANFALFAVAKKKAHREKKENYFSLCPLPILQPVVNVLCILLHSMFAILITIHKIYTTNSSLSQKTLKYTVTWLSSLD